MLSRANAYDLDLAKDGAQHFPGAAAAARAEICAALHEVPHDRAGVRIQGIEALRPILDKGGPVGSLAASFLGQRCRPVRAILFDKTPATNWSLAWHQDRTICVKMRMDVKGYGPWTIKAGIQHVAPPFALLARMLTLRVHLDDVPADNAPLLIAPGSHMAGRVATEGYDDVVSRCGTRICLAKAGDVWVYATPILHASAASKQGGHRRVLQVDYSADDLDCGLEWLGV
ncbi:MAG: phytanoyl-CoA dioxygenase family protein [Sphingomonas sp.]|nr:phytanoyl-CoA dioxygenase family protein [Sphingomonas sp.]